MPEDKQILQILKFDSSLGYVSQSLYILTSHAGFARLDLQDFSVN